MKQTPMRLVPFLLVLISIMACKTDSPLMENPPATSAPTGPGTNPVTDSLSSRLRIRVGSSTFTATLANNATGTAFRARFPLTLSMKELNGNEKFTDLSNSLPTNAISPGTIQSGDLMLYGSSTLVLFYETFRTSYSYTRLGRIDNPAGLVTAVGAGNVTVSFDLER